MQRLLQGCADKLGQKCPTGQIPARWAHLNRPVQIPVFRRYLCRKFKKRLRYMLKYQHFCRFYEKTVLF